MVPGHEALREIALQKLDVLYHPEYGLAAGKGRFEALYPRDVIRFTSLVLSHPANYSIPGIIEMTELSLDNAFALQGKEPKSPTDDQALGKILHQWQNRHTPPERTKELVANGWTPYITPDGETEIRYYGAGDTTSGIITAAFLLAKAKEAIHGLPTRNKYLNKIWDNLKAAFNHEVRIADIDGDGLIESVPKNPTQLYHHTERDSSEAFDSEEGKRPKPPFKYLGNNSIFLYALGHFAQMANWMGEANLAKEAKEIERAGRIKYLERFWMREEGYLSPLVFGDESIQAHIITDEATDGLYYGLVNYRQANSIVKRLMKPDLMTVFGPRTRSAKSTQFAENGAPSYWNGTVWTHRIAMAAEAMTKFGFNREAHMLDTALARLVKEKGCVELVAVDRSEHLLPYMEDGQDEAACNPQLFAVGAVLARTAA